MQEEPPEAEGRGQRLKDVQRTGMFKRGFRRMCSRGMNMELLKSVILTLQAGGKLDEKYQDHQLEGKWRDSKECHLQPDWLLIYRITDDAVILQATGTHSDLFK